MSLHQQLLKRAAEGKPIRVGLIGAGKFGSMYLSQVPRTAGVHLVAIADLSPAAARNNLARVGWDPQRTQAASIEEALKTGATHVGDDCIGIVSHAYNTYGYCQNATVVGNTLNGQATIHLGGFSKTLAANLRVGFIACSAPLARQLTDLKMLVGLTSSELGERIVLRVRAPDKPSFMDAPERRRP